MARLLRFASIALALLLTAALCTGAWAQPGPGGPPNRPGPGPGGPGGFFGGPGMGGMVQSPYSLLSADSVAKELELTDAQKAKIKEINDKAQTGMRGAFEGMRDVDPEDREKVMAKIRDKMETQRKETNKALQAELLPHQLKRLRGIFVQLRGEQALRDPEVQEALGLSQDQKNKIRSIVEILTEDQKADFEKMKGEKFDVGSIRMGGFGGFGPGGRGPGGPGGFGPGGFGPGGERRRPPAKKEAAKPE